ncbi:MAG: hypothetical protein J6A28_00345 [Clostridia bacterium]|nr:hypothetical protein [Clostridia bacterium]
MDYKKKMARYEDKLNTAIKKGNIKKRKAIEESMVCLASRAISSKYGYTTGRVVIYQFVEENGRAKLNVTTDVHKPLSGEQISKALKEKNASLNYDKEKKEEESLFDLSEFHIH